MSQINTFIQVEMIQNLKSLPIWQIVELFKQESEKALDPFFPEEEEGRTREIRSLYFFEN